MESVRVGVSKILGAEPDTAIKPAIWQELLRMRLALLSLATAVDERNAAILAANSDNALEETTGLLTHKMYLGTLCVVDVVVSEKFGADTAVAWFKPYAGSIRASLAYGATVDGLSIYQDAETPAGGTRSFMLKGMYINTRGTVNTTPYVTPAHHSRLSAESIYDPGGGGYVYTSADFKGNITWMSDMTAAYHGFYNVAGYYYIGHIVGSMVASSTEPGSPGLYFDIHAKGALVYFNPRRA